MSKKDRLEKFNFMPNEEQTAINNSNLGDMFRGLQTDYAYLPLNEIEPNPENDYAQEDSEQEIQKLAEDIHRNGLLHNIVVSEIKPNHYKLLSGERRLHAYQYLLHTTNDEKYKTIYALIKRNLSPRQELIIMDAANLQTRGAVADERKFRKAGIRFVENLKEEFSISDKEAIRMAKEYADVQERTIDRNIQLERDLHKPLLALLDQKKISKKEALLFASLPQELQSTVADILLKRENEPQKIFFATVQTLFSLTKDWKKYADEINTRNELLEQIRFEKKYADTEEKEILTAQEEKVLTAIQKSKQSLSAAENKIDNLKISENTQTQSGISDHVLREMEKTVASLEKDCTSLQKQWCVEKKKYLSPSAQKALFSRLAQIESVLHDLLSE